VLSALRNTLPVLIVVGFVLWVLVRQRGLREGLRMEAVQPDSVDQADSADQPGSVDQPDSPADELTPTADAGSTGDGEEPTPLEAPPDPRSRSRGRGGPRIQETRTNRGST
jgi:hypothetical protein